MYIYIYLHTYIHTYRFVCVCVCACMSMYIYIYMYIYTYSHIYIYTYIYTYIYVCVCLCVCVCARAEVYLGVYRWYDMCTCSWDVMVRCNIDHRIPKRVLYTIHTCAILGHCCFMRRERRSRCMFAGLHAKENSLHWQPRHVCVYMCVCVCILWCVHERVRVYRNSKYEQDTCADVHICLNSFVSRLHAFIKVQCASCIWQNKLLPMHVAIMHRQAYTIPFNDGSNQIKRKQ